MYELDKVIFFTEEKYDSFAGSIIVFNDQVMVVRSRFCGSVPMHRKVHLLIYDSLRGEVEYEGCLKNTYRNLVIFENLVFVQNRQRRMDVRVDAGFILQVRRLYAGSSGPIDLNGRIPMQAVNLSSSGILLQCAIDLPKYVGLRLEIPISGEPVHCNSEIVRKEKTAGGFRYGCRFSAISEREKDRIRGFVFRKQIEARKRKILLENEKAAT